MSTLRTRKTLAICTVVAFALLTAVTFIYLDLFDETARGINGKKGQKPCFAQDESSRLLSGNETGPVQRQVSMEKVAVPPGHRSDWQASFEADRETVRVYGSFVEADGKAARPSAPWQRVV